MEMHSNSPSTVTEVPLVRGLAFMVINVLNSQNDLQSPEPELSGEDKIVSFLESFARE